nr:hypothetical protein [Candidatus Njordarchaeum guaymaensis]
MIESLYIVDSSGLCLFSSPLVPLKQFEPNLVCGFIVAQHHCFQDAFGEETRRFTLEKKEILIQNVDLKDRNVLLAIAHTIGSEKEEKFSRIILDSLTKAFKNNEKIFRNLSEGVTKDFEEEMAELVKKTLKAVPCLHIVKGFLGITDHCDKIDAPITDGRPCDFDYAVSQCEYYSAKSD